MKEYLLTKVRSGKAVIGVAGLGYVGLPLALRFAEAGFAVIGFDIDQKKVESLNRGESYFSHIPWARVETVVKSGRFRATSDFSLAREADAVILCVPTPLGAHQEPDLSFVIKTAESFMPFIRAGQVVSLESTTYPGTTDAELRPMLERRGFTVGKDVFLIYSPEREDPGNSVYTTGVIPKVVGGTTPACLEAGVALYGAIIDRVVPVSSTQAAEMTKLLENIYRAVNIGLVNEMKVVADRMGLDIWEVIDAAATKPFGFTPFYPGPGLGGHCIPIDPFYLTWKAREYGINTRFIELAGQINTAMPEWVAGKVGDALNVRGKPVKGSRVLVLGISYKKNIDDMRESPAVLLMDILKSRGAVISYSDPYVPVFPEMRKYNFRLKSVPLTAAALKGADCVVITADHDSFDYEFIRKESSLVVDTRGRYRKKYKNVVKA